MRFQKNDIVLNAASHRPGIFLITDVVPSRPVNPYSGVNILTGKAFKLSDASLGKKVGVACDEFLNGSGDDTTNVASNLNYERGKRRAELASRSLGLVTGEQERWKALANAKPGDVLIIRYGYASTKEVTFQYVLDKGVKYVFAATTKGGATYRYPLAALIVAPTKKRTETEILEDFRGVESALSPENLSCDGELPINIINQRRRQLEGERAALIAELGRTPSFNELYPELSVRQ